MFVCVHVFVDRSECANVKVVHNRSCIIIYIYGAIQVLRNALVGGRVSDFPEKSVTKMYGSTLLALRGDGWVSNLRKKALHNT